MNLGGIRQRVYDRIDIPTSDPLMTPDKITRFINDAIHLITMQRDWPWLQGENTFTTVVGQQGYTLTTIVPLPQIWVATRELVLTWGSGNALFQVLELKQRLALDDRFDLTPQQRPYNWSIWNDQIVLAPPPDDLYVIKHRYWITEPDLVSDTDTPLMPAEFHQTICDYASFLCFRRDREDPQAKVSWDSYQDGLKSMIRRHRQIAGPLKVRVRPGGGLGGPWS